MLLRKIRYHNFRPFIGDQSIDLINENKGSDANVTIILGDNTFGKSTFVLSFIWCLYGESRFTRANDILNKKVEARMPCSSNNFESKEIAYVEVEFEDDNKLYTMRRTQEFKKNDKGRLKALDAEATLTYVNSSGETFSAGNTQNEIDLAIKAILPLDLSSFFFFEGEKNNEIKRKDLGTAVRTLLGLEAYDRMRSHLYGSQTQTSPYVNSIMGYYLERQKDESGTKAQEEFGKMERAEAAYKEADDRITELDNEIDNYQNLIDAINERLRQAAPSQELQKRRDQIANEIRDAQKNLEKKRKALFEAFSRDSVPLFVTPLLSAATNRLEKMQISDKGIKGIEAVAIRELLHRGECLCGTDLKEGSLAYKNVARYIDYVPPRSLGTLVRDMQENIDETTEKNKAFVEHFEEIYRDIATLRIQINSLEAEDKEKLAQIGAIGEVDTSDAEENLSNYRHRINDLRNERDLQISIRSTKQSEKETASNNFNMYKTRSQKVLQYQKYYAYAEAIFNWVNSNYSKKEEALRARLNSYITSLFENMYSGKRDIQIDEKYNINMTYKGETVDDTGGLRVIQYFAYVGGLVKLAYEVMKEREVDEEGNSEAMGEQYPLVLDAAFSHADEIHTKNIARELSNSASQLVFAIMKKDWRYAKEGLTGKIGRMYELKKIDETEVQIQEVK